MPATLAAPPKELTLELRPDSRVQVINIKKRIRSHFGDVLHPYRKAAYCSFHTTAGYFEQSLCTRLDNDQQKVEQFVRGFEHLFPAEADYMHDQIELRNELSEEQKACEPRNADSHLKFIGAGLANYATYDHHPEQPVFFVELDGVNVTDRTHRTRRTRVIGFNQAKVVDTVPINIPVSTHAVDSVNFRDSRLSIMAELQHWLDRFEIRHGRVDLSLAPQERNAGLTVNEYETLLMQHDLADVLRNPLRFMARKGINMLRDPRSIPSKARNYAKYDLVRICNEFIDVLGLNETVVERLMDKFLAPPARRFLRMKRNVSLLVSDDQDTGNGSILYGRYQSPILVQWRQAKAQSRQLQATFIRFE